MVTRGASLKDCDSITQIHLQSFNKFFLSSLGERFLKIFYKTCIKNPESIAVVCCTPEREMAGFAVGTLNSKGYYKRLLIKNLSVFGPEAVKLLFTKPKALLRLALNLTKTKENEDSANMAELLSIAILPELRGAGIGKLLIIAFEAKLKEKSCEAVSLTTDFYDNEDVIKFYQKCGYVIKNEFTTYPDRRMYRMIKYL
jgi:ribosomal protein S18 acetylase RimI-like enzyme